MFCLNLHYTEANNYLLVIGVEVIKLKAEDSEINAIPLCLGNISKGILCISLRFYCWSWCYCCCWYIRHSQIFNEKE